MTANGLVEDVVRSFLTDSTGLSRHIGSDVHEIEIDPVPYPSNRNYVYPCVINKQYNVVVKYSPRYLDAIEDEVRAYKAVRSLKNIPQLIDYGSGLIVLSKIQNARPTRVEDFNGKTVDKIMNFMASLRDIEGATIEHDTHNAIIAASRQLTAEFKSISMLSQYFKNTTLIVSNYENLTLEASNCLTRIHRTHGDLSFSNILESREGLFFVDWEMSRVTDGATDIARLIRDLVQNMSVFDRSERLEQLKKILSVANYFIETYANEIHDRNVWPRIYFWLVTRLLNGGNHFERIRHELDILLTEIPSITIDTARPYFSDNAARIDSTLKGIGAICPVQDIHETLLKFQAGLLEEYQTMIQRYQWEIDLRCQYATRLAVGAALFSEALLTHYSSEVNSLPDAESFT